jgi:serine/threonine protein kinase
MRLGTRFQVVRKLGEGTFGRVLECIDLQTKNLVAVKVILVPLVLYLHIITLCIDLFRL